MVKGLKANFRRSGRVAYLNNQIEGDHRFIRKIIRPMLGFKSFSSAAKTIAGIEVVHMIRKGQMATQGYCPLRIFEQFRELFD